MGRSKLNNRSGFSLVEAVVSALILSIAATGLYATISSMSQPTEDSLEEVNAANAGRQVLEELRSIIDATNWNDAMLDPTGNPHNLSELPNYAANTITLDGITYTIQYNVVDDAQSGSKRLDLNITW